MAHDDSVSLFATQLFKHYSMRTAVIVCVQVHGTPTRHFFEQLSLFTLDASDRCGRLLSILLLCSEFVLQVELLINESTPAPTFAGIRCLKLLVLKGQIFIAIGILFLE